MTREELCARYGGFRVRDEEGVQTEEYLNEGEATDALLVLRDCWIEHQDPETKEWKRW